MTAASNPQVLVVDDDPGMIRAVSRVLAKDYSVITATTASDALQRAAQTEPDIAILDIRMPDMDGFELMQLLLARRPELDVILMTGNASEPEQQLIRAIEEGAFYFIQKPFERRVLLTLVARCLELRRLQQERQRHLQRLQRELEEARRFQHSMIPPDHRVIGGIAVHARYEACCELAGDFYDYATTDDGALAFLVADVSGHGVSAAMLTGIVKSSFHAAAADDYEPLAVVQRVADGIQAFDPRRFVTLFCGRMDGATSQLRFTNAGHPPGILQRAAHEIELLHSTGPLICSGFRTLPFEQGAVDFSAGDRLLVYTDGLIEAMGPHGAYGREKLMAAVAACAHRGARFVDSLLAQVADYTGDRPPDDDVTLLCADWNPGAPVSA